MAEQLRVVHMAAYGGPYSGSFIPMLGAARIAAQSRGWRFEALFTPGADQHRWYSDLQATGMNIQVAPMSGKRGAIAAVRELLSQRELPTLLHTHFSYWDLPAVLAARRRRNPAVVWHLHSSLHDERITRAKNVMHLGVGGRLADRILCVGPEILESALARSAPRARTQLFPNGIDLGRFAPAQEGDRLAARRRLGIPDAATVLLLFAWDWETKGGPLLLDVVRELRSRGREVIGAVVGSEAQARSGARRLGIDAAIIPLAPAEDVRALYSAADLLIAASPSEGFGFALLESLCCGTPVIASDIPAHRYTAGLLSACRFAPRRSVEFCDTVEAELDADFSDRAARLAQSRAQIDRDYSLQSWSRRLLDVYDLVLGARGARRLARQR